VNFGAGPGLAGHQRLSQGRSDWGLAAIVRHRVLRISRTVPDCARLGAGQSHAGTVAPARIPACRMPPRNADCCGNERKERRNSLGHSVFYCAAHGTLRSFAVAGQPKGRGRRAPGSVRAPSGGRRVAGTTAVTSFKLHSLDEVSGRSRRWAAGLTGGPESRKTTARL